MSVFVSTMSSNSQFVGWVWMVLLLVGVVVVVFQNLTMDLSSSAAKKSIMPITCPTVHSFSNIAKLIKRVVAFRAVEVRDMVSAPKFLVMAAEQDDPKNPMVEKRTTTPIFM